MVLIFGLDNPLKFQKENMESLINITSSKLLEKEDSAKSRLALKKKQDRNTLSKS